jgi:hypothetical protein
MKTPILLALVFVLIQGTAAAAQDGPSTSNVLASPPNRYVLGQISGFRRDQFLLDTMTGRAWVIVTDKAGNYSFERIPFTPGDEPSGETASPPQPKH